MAAGEGKSAEGRTGRPVRAGRSQTGYKGPRPAAAARYFVEQRAWPAGIPVGWYDRARTHLRTMEERGLRKNTAGWRWLSLGPANIAGRMRSMALDPTDPSVLYAGSAGGGIWKSTNEGVTWRALTDGRFNRGTAWP